MSKLLLRSLIKRIIESNNDQYSNQLVSNNKDTEEENKIELEEFSGCGAVAGMILPLGTEPKKEKQ